MRCEQFSILIDRHLAGSLSQDEQLKLQEHLDSCADCRLTLTMRQDGLSLDEGGEVPAAFSSAWRQAIKEEETEQMEQKEDRKVIRPSFRFRRWMAVAAALVLVVGGTVLTRTPQPARDTAYSGEAAYSYGMGAPGMTRGMEAGGGNEAAQKLSAMPAAEAPMDAAQAPLVREAKLIRRVNLSINTRAFQDDLNMINEAIRAQGGFVEYSSLSAASETRRNASLTARIPKEKLDSFLAALSGVGQLSNRTESQEDVSDQYYDVDTRLKTQKSKMERLQDLLSKAKTVEDILNIENRIAETQYQIDSMEGSLRGIDSKVDYSTVQIDLREQTLPVKPQNPSLLERLGFAIADAFSEFVDFLQDLLFFVIAVLPYLLVLLVLAIVIRIIVKRRKKK